MPTPLDLTGQPFGSLTALRPGRTTYGRYGWVCRCELCKAEATYLTSHLTGDKSRACQACGQSAAGTRAAARNNAPADTRPCAVCKTLVPVRKGASKTRRVYCSAPACRNRGKNAARNTRLLPLPPRACEVCGRAIDRPRRNQRYCDADCGQVADAKVLAAKHSGTPEQQAARIQTQLEGRRGAVDRLDT